MPIRGISSLDSSLGTSPNSLMCGVVQWSAYFQCSVHPTWQGALPATTLFSIYIYP